ncbi:MAG: sensor histidine kinase [Bacteroidetes bacterium]|nr:sensor histidine kinase [Bacteroidota bacterium]
MNLKALFFQVLDFGVQQDQSFHHKRRVKSVNLLNLVVILFLLIGLTNWFFIRDNFPIVAELVFMIMAAVSLFLSYKKYVDIAFALFTLNVNFSLFFIGEYYPPETGTYLFYFPVIVSIVLLNNPSRIDKWSLFHFMVCLVFFALSLIIDLPDWQIKNIESSQIKIIWYYDVFLSIFLTGLLTFLLNKTIFNQNKEIIVQLKDIEKTKAEVKLSLKEKEILLAELHHRVKNNLAIISGLLNLQEDAINNKEAKQIISETKNRIMSMALVHKMLFKNPEFKKIDLGKYSSQLIAELFNSYHLKENVEIEEIYDAIDISINLSIPLGLILNEIVTNSIKYGFKDTAKQNNKFFISIKKSNHFVSLIVKDSGDGFTKDFNTDLETSSLGIVLIKSLTDQIEGKVLFTNNNGAKIEINFPNN